MLVLPGREDRCNVATVLLRVRPVVLNLLCWCVDCHVLPAPYCCAAHPSPLYGNAVVPWGLVLHCHAAVLSSVSVTVLCLFSPTVLAAVLSSLGCCFVFVMLSFRVALMCP